MNWSQAIWNGLSHDEQIRIMAGCYPEFPNLWRVFVDVLIDQEHADLLRMRLAGIAMKVH